MKKIILLATGLLFLAASPAFAQSNDRDHPTLLSTSEIRGSLNNHSEENFYSFVAGPGELTVTLDIKARSGEQGEMNFELLARNDSTPILCCEYAQADEGGTGRDVKSVKLTRRQTIILHTTNSPIGGGTFHIRLSGASAFGGAANTTGDNDSDNNRDNDNRGRNEHSNGNRIDVPASGILRIRMKDGSTKEIDLSLVREISVKP